MGIICSRLKVYSNLAHAGFFNALNSMIIDRQKRFLGTDSLKIEHTVNKAVDKVNYYSQLMHYSVGKSDVGQSR